MLVKIKKSQSTLEYAILVGVVIGALISMQSYLKRSLQGKLKEVGDQLGKRYSPGGTKLTEETTTTGAVHTETYAIGHGTKTAVTDNVANIRNTETRQMKADAHEWWPKRSVKAPLE